MKPMWLVLSVALWPMASGVEAASPSAASTIVRGEGQLLTTDNMKWSQTEAGDRSVRKADSVKSQELTPSPLIVLVKRKCLEMRHILLIVTALIASRIAVHAESRTLSESGELRKIVSVAKGFWVSMNLGDMKNLEDLVREEDIQKIPQAKGEGAEMMKMQSLPQLKPLREKIASAIEEAYVFEEPKVNTDGKTAIVRLSVKVDKLRQMFELKEVYDH